MTMEGGRAGQMELFIASTEQVKYLDMMLLESNDGQAPRKIGNHVLPWRWLRSINPSP
jgi:hypothetical protein